MKYVLGIDQGGSKTLALIADAQGHILGLGRGGGACHSVTGMESAMDAIRISVGQALAQAGISAAQIDVVAAGLTGVDWDYEAELLRRNAAQTLQIASEKFHVVNDCLIALRAGTSKSDGCILCAGSGLNCGVRHADGREYTFGYYIEDRNQGGAALGRRALQAVYDAQAGLCPPTLLTELVTAAMGCESAEQLLMQQTSVGLDNDKVLYLPQVLEKAALQGDAVAKDVLRTFGEDIAQYVVAGLKRFDMLDGDVEVVLSGSVFKCRARELMDAVAGRILSAAPRAEIRQSVYEPVVGAVLMALDRLGMDAEKAENIERDAHRIGMVRGQKG